MSAGMNYTEENVASAFSKQAVIFDEIYSGNTIVQYKRKRVRDHLQQYLKPGNNILELNSGTGEDAIWLAQQGYTIHATDLSAGMQQILRGKVEALHLRRSITQEQCSFTALNNLEQKGPYNYIFSNFAGLNCTDQLDKVLQSLPALLTPGGVVTLVILPTFCFWESLLVFKGKFKTAFRRFFSSRGRKAHIEGEYFKCWYYNPSYILQHTKEEFDLLAIEGLCSVVPPSYIENFAEKYPRLFNWMKKKEECWKSSWPWKYIGDYYIISLRKKEVSRNA